MIPLKLNKLFYGKYKWLYRISATLLSLALLSGVAYYQFLRLQDALSKGRDPEEFGKPIREELFDSASIGLERYRNHVGHYPSIEGKYFVDSIKWYVGSAVSVFKDSITRDGDTLLMGWGTYQKYDYLKTDGNFFGIGRPEVTIIYKPIGNTYLMYSVGQNELDEGGGGDDVVYQKKKWYEIWK
jgi:hypothetical protein